MAVAVLFVLAVWLLPKIPSEGRALDAARNVGLTNVHVTGRSYAWGALGGCHEDDLTKFKVSGTAPDGTQRTIQVCAPLIGGYTVRS